MHGVGLSSLLPRLWLASLHHVLYRLRAKPHGQSYEAAGDALEMLAERLGLHAANVRDGLDQVEAFDLPAGPAGGQQGRNARKAVSHRRRRRFGGGLLKTTPNPPRGINEALQAAKHERERESPL